MSENQRGYLIIAAATSLGVCMVAIVIGFVIVVVQAQDGEQVRLLSDNLWQLVWPLAGAMAAIVGVSHFTPGALPTTPGGPTNPDPPAPPNPTPPTPQGGV